MSAQPDAEDGDLPVHVRRLFPASSSSPSLALHSAYVTGRLLEDGDGRDLRWLLRRVGPERLRAWVVAHGARSLSRRSHAFWSLVLFGDPRPARRPSGRELWPLA